jgi:hypothetical protein
VPDRRGNPPQRISIPSGSPGDTPRVMSGYTKEALAKRIERITRDHPDFMVVEQGQESTSGGQVTASIEQPPEVWPRFAAKVALATASLIAPDDWLDSPKASQLQGVLWNGPPPDAAFEPGFDWCALPLQLLQAPGLVPPEHLLVFETGGFSIVVFAELLFRIRGFEWEWTDGNDPSSWPQSWWFSADEPGGRQLPTQVQRAFLDLRSRSTDPAPTESD